MNNHCYICHRTHASGTTFCMGDVTPCGPGCSPITFGTGLNVPGLVFAPPPSCLHCFCIEMKVRKKPHRKCCNCGIKQVKIYNTTFGEWHYL